MLVKPDCIVWPRGLVCPEEWNPGYNSQDGGGDQLTLSGRFHTSSVGRGIWQPSFTIFVHKHINYDLWRALDAQIGGRDVPIIVPYYPGEYKPKFTSPINGTSDSSAFNGVSYSDGSMFSDGSFFDSIITVSSVSSAQLAGETCMTVTKEGITDILPGHAFSIGNHLYTVRFVEQTETSATITIQPELRKDVNIGDRLEFDNPVVKCRLMDPTSMSNTVSGLFTGTTDIQFVEDTS